MFKGKRHYNEFFESEERVSTSVLGDRLKSLEESGIISKGQDEIKKSRIKYSLTEKGIALLPMMIEMIIWSGTFDRETAAGDDFLELARSNKTALLMNLTKKLTGTHLAQ